MSPGNIELVQIVASWAVTLPAVAAIVIRDERSLTGETLARAWPPQSRDAAIFGLWNLGVHHLCVVLHFARTRRSARGVFIGFVWLCAVVAVDIGVQTGVLAAIDWLGL